MTEIRETILSVLGSHSLRTEFERILSSRLPSSDADVADIWSVEVHPKEGQCSFSKPLIIATEATPACRVVRIAHSWADVWDVTYDPLYEFTVDARTGAWTPCNVYRTHEGGFRVFSSAAEVAAAAADCEAWALVIRERGYADVRQAGVRVLSHGHSAGDLRVESK